MQCSNTQLKESRIGGQGMATLIPSEHVSQMFRYLYLMSAKVDKQTW